MDSVLLDTDVFSLFFRRDTRSLLYDNDIRGKVRCLSFASVAELRFGAIAGGWHEPRQRQLEDAIGYTVILEGDDLTTQQWAKVKAGRQSLGRPIGSEDCWIAATALRHGLTLLTHNAKDYADIPNLQIVSHPG
jgi:predicted nucleic acid-binding protein